MILSEFEQKEDVMSNRSLPTTQLLFNLIGFALGLIWPLLASSQLHHHRALPTIALSGHDGWITSVDYSPDGRFLVSGSSDRTVRVWSVADSEEVSTFVGHMSMVNAVEFSPDGELIISASSDATVRIWSLSKQKEIATIVAHKYGVNDVTFSPDGKLFATAARDYTVKLWSTETLEAIAVLDRQRNLVQSVQFSPDGRRLLTGSDSTRLWEVSDFTQLDSWNVTSGWTWAIDFSPSADIFLTAQSNGQVKLWRASDRKEIQSLVGHESDVSEAKFSPNGQFIASVSREIRLWSVIGMSTVARLKDGENYIHSVDFSPDGRSIATGTHNRTILIWDIQPYLNPTILQAEVVSTTFESVEIDINVANASDLYGFQFDLKFDSKILTLQSVTEGNFLKKVGGDTYWMPGTVDDSSGVIHRILGMRLAPGEVIGKGQLARLSFLPKQTFDNQIEVTNFQLSNEESKPIVAYANGVTVNMPIRVSADIFVNAWTDGPNVLAEVQLGFPVNVYGFQVDLNYPSQLELLPLDKPELVFDINKVRGITQNTLFKFRIHQGGDLKFTLSDGLLSGPLETTALPTLYSKQIEVVAAPPWDINRDYVVDLFDLVILASHLGQEILGQPRPNPDVNRDGKVDLFDFVKVGANYNRTHSPNPVNQTDDLTAPTALGQPTIDLSDLIPIVLELEQHPMANHPDFLITRQLLSSLISPQCIRLYPNYPNPFNPETWIPFQLHQTTEVVIKIYDVAGACVRQLYLGMQHAGSYLTKGLAAYWDGKNKQGEQLPSGIYYYQLHTNKPQSTVVPIRSMMIVK